MFGSRVDLFTLFGFTVRVDASWLFIAALLTWSLAAGVFPAAVPGLPAATYWWMGAAGCLGLFASVVLHELAHSLVARRHGIHMHGITLFIFGGVAEMQDEPSGPRAEFLTAVVGPVSSLLLAAGLFGLSRVAAGTWPAAVTAVLEYLGTLNFILAAFNLIPGFPLDGGRILRAALWGWKGSLRRATRISARIGGWVGIGLAALGILQLFTGNPIGGMWWVLIGVFLRNAAEQSYQQLLLRRALGGEPVRRFMQRNPVTVPRHISLRDLVEDYVYRSYFKMFPVMDDDRLVGCITTDHVKAVPREAWDRESVGAIAERCSPDNTVSPDLDAMAALGTMSRTGRSRLLVVEGNRLVGVLTLKDLLQFFSRRVELEEAA